MTPASAGCAATTRLRPEFGRREFAFSASREGAGWHADERYGPLMVAALSVLRYPNFRRLWLGQTLSTVGDRLVMVALALFVVERTGSAGDLAIVLAAYDLPLVAFVLIGGVWADRLPRQRIMIGTDLARAALHALLATLILTGTVEIWMVAAIEALMGTCEAFFRPAYSGLVPQTVPEEEIQHANAITAGSANAAEMLGPLIATALVLGLGAGQAFAIDAASFLVSAVLLARVHARPRGEPAPRQPWRRELAEGFHEVRSRTWVWATIIAFSITLFAAFAPFLVLGPVIAEEVWGSAGYYGLGVGIFGAGTLVGAILGLRLRPQRPLRAAIVAALPWPLALLTYALGGPLPLVYVVLAIGGVCIALFDVWWQTALAERIPPHALSRVTAYDWMGSLAMVPLGYIVAGVLADAVGARTVLAVGSLVGVAALALALTSRELRALQRNPPEPVAEVSSVASRS
jgi:MFS family permease